MAILLYLKGGGDLASKYWIKLYHEIIDDPKMARLSDRLYRRLIELFLLAGEINDDGRLPPIEDMAWKLRRDVEELTDDLFDLEKFEFLHEITAGEWYVTNFAKRQAADSDTERWRRWKERQNKQKYYGGDTKDQRQTNVTLVDTDIDIESDTEEKLNGVTAYAETPEPVVKVPKKKKKDRDPLLDNPAIIAYRDEARLHVPIPWREEVCNKVDDPERWKELVHDWIGHGWNKQNISGMLEAYENGGIGSKKEEPAGFAGLRDYAEEQGWTDGKQT